MGRFLDRLAVELPVVQAGMGGGIAGPELAAAVSKAGGLGTLGISPPSQMRAELATARRLTDRPLAVNLLLPFARRGHRHVAAEADVVVTFWGKPRRFAPGLWIHQCGSVHEAIAAHAAGADAVIAQGVEAGGHVRGRTPAMPLLDDIHAVLPGGFPVLLAGGVASSVEVEQAMSAGAAAAVLGTRFVLSEESRAHAEYKRRLVGAGETVLTELFGLGWPAAPHRVVPNEATRRWTANDRRGPAWLRTLNRLASPALSRLPSAVQRRALALQRPGRPPFSPGPPVEGSPESLVDSGPLYAGETVKRFEDVQPAGRIVEGLAP